MTRICPACGKPHEAAEYCPYCNTKVPNNFITTDQAQSSSLNHNSTEESSDKTSHAEVSSDKPAGCKSPAKIPHFVNGFHIFAILFTVIMFIFVIFVSNSFALSSISSMISPNPCNNGDFYNSVDGKCYTSCQAGKYCTTLGSTCCGTTCCNPGYTVCSDGHCCSPSKPYWYDGNCWEKPESDSSDSKLSSSSVTSPNPCNNGDFYNSVDGKCYTSCQTGKYCPTLGSTCCGTKCCAPGYTVCSDGHCCSPSKPYWYDGYCWSVNPDSISSISSKSSGSSSSSGGSDTYRMVVTYDKPNAPHYIITWQSNSAGGNCAGTSSQVCQMDGVSGITLIQSGGDVKVDSNGNMIYYPLKIEIYNSNRELKFSWSSKNVYSQCNQNAAL